MTDKRDALMKAVKELLAAYDDAQFGKLWLGPGIKTTVANLRAAAIEPSPEPSENAEEVARKVWRDIYCQTCANTGVEANGRPCRDCDHAHGILARALTDFAADAVRVERERMQMAKERIAHLEKYVGEHLSYMGACEDGDDESLCESPDCTYCQMARALQPSECGFPLAPTGDKP